MSDALHQALQAKRADLDYLHPYNVPLHLVPEAPVVPPRTDHRWIDFGDREAREWSRVLFLLPRQGHSATVMAAASSTWRFGRLPNLNNAPEVARAARALGHTPESAWEMLVTLIVMRQDQEHDPNVAYDLRVWALWIERMNHLADPITAASHCLKAVGQR